MTSEIKDAADALGAAGYFAGHPDRRVDAVSRAVKAGVSPAQVSTLARFALRTHARPGAFLGSVLGGSGDLLDAVACAEASEACASVLDLRRRELEIREQELEQKRKIELGADRHIDRSREPNPLIRECGLDPSLPSSVVAAYRDWRFALEELAYWTGRTEDEVRGLLLDAGIELRGQDK